jgi:hypothetical protein
LRSWIVGGEEKNRVSAPFSALWNTQHGFMNFFADAYEVVLDGQSSVEGRERRNKDGCSICPASAQRRYSGIINRTKTALAGPIS